jgi:8-oxo-dGTP pyrophosphatase MutT (NUDIX family)
MLKPTIVYLNEAILLFGDGHEGIAFTDIQLNDSHPNWISWIEFLKDKQGAYRCCIEGQSTDEVWNNFCAEFKLITAAGGRVKNEQQSVLLIFRREKWDLPKGKVDDGETIEEAALREVKEECGLQNLVLLKNIGIIYHIYFHKQKWVLKDTHWFDMKGTLLDPLIPQLEEDITSMEWVDANDERWKKNTFPSILQVMAW